MKSLLKTYKKLLAILLVIVSCQAEDDQLEIIPEQSEFKSEISSTLMSFEKIPHYSQIQSKMDDLKSSIGQMQESYVSGLNIQNENTEPKGVEVLYDNVLYMTYANTHTYTFTVIREKPKYYIENIVLHYNIESNFYDEYLVQYDVTAEQYLSLARGELLTEKAETIITPLNKGTFDSYTTSAGGSTCSVTCSTINVPCASGLHEVNDPQCDFIPKYPDSMAFSYVGCTTTCVDVTLSDNDNPTPLSGGSGGGNGSVNTSPLPANPCIPSKTLPGFGNDIGDVGIIGGNGECTPVEDFEIFTNHQSFVNTKTKCIHDKLANDISDNNFYEQLLSLFRSDPTDILQYKVGITPGQDWGITKGHEANNFSSGFDFYTITTSHAIENSSNLARMVTLAHELTHVMLMRTLDELGLIVFLPNGDPQLNVDCGNYAINLLLSPLSVKHRFAALICVYNQANPTSLQWTHSLFNTASFNVMSYKSQIENLILEENDWANENPFLISSMQDEFGTDWKEKTSEYISWVGLEQTTEFTTWAVANNLTSNVVNGVISYPAFNTVIANIKALGSKKCD
ncbi:hypothetical protein D7030_01330 [Flavobacteriaceae bacterium AU392]|nr:hypothetical protein D1817_07785 [Flavobacteriaceae bacterium]RKM86521.1 hypothetical protein D7030_01330 [Flavobacteriaceae bacterium AU392]